MTTKPDSHRTYVEGYDDGYDDAWRARDPKYRRPRNTNASSYRFGYADGWADGRNLGGRDPRPAPR